MKKKILLCALSFIAIALFSCGIAFLPNWNPKPTTPPDIGQEEVTDAKTITSSALIVWGGGLNYDATTKKNLMFNDTVSYTLTSGGHKYTTTLQGAKAKLKIVCGTVNGKGDDWGTAEVTQNKNPATSSGSSSVFQNAAKCTITYSFKSSYYGVTVSGSTTEGSLSDIESGDVVEQKDGFGIIFGDFKISVTMTLIPSAVSVTLYDSYTKEAINYDAGSILGPMFFYADVIDVPEQYGRIPTHTGYTFDGWYQGTPTSMSSTCVSKGDDILIDKIGDKAKWTAKYVPNTYSVKFYRNTSSTDKTTSTQSGFTYDQSKALQANPWKRDGYTFKGWSTSRTATTATYTNGQSVKNLTTSGTVNLYAVWAPNTYSVKFYRNHSSSDTTTSTQSGFTYDQSKALQANPWTRDGYTFKGWSTSRTATTATYTNGQSVKNLTTSGTVNLYAVWARNNYYVDVNNYLDGGANGSAISHGLSFSVKVDGVVKGTGLTDFYYGDIPYNSKVEVYDIKIGSGYSYSSYTVSPSGYEQSGSSKSHIIVTTPAQQININLYFVTNSYTLTVNPNGGTWNGSSSSQNFTQNYNTTKAIANPVRYGYYFDRWALSGSGSISGTTFTFGAGNTTLTAQWIETWAVNYTKPSGSGTASSPYQVDSASDLAYFAYKTQILGEQCFDHIVLTKDIDLAGYDWMPIGTGRNVVSGVQPYFRGTFDGQGHTISNLNINVEGYQELNEYGLFGLIDVDAVLKNFTILSGEVNGSAKVGGAVGWLWSASVENVINYANINGSSYVGGIVGNYHSWEGNFVRECQNYGTITGTNYTAGIVGGGDDSSGMQNIVDCVNYGTIKGASFTGGIVGNIVKVKMSGCVNYGSISGQDRVGGIAGRVNNNSVVFELVNYGDVTGWTHVAGILGGAAYADSATSCFNLGNIKGESHIGGVIGYVYDGITLTNSANFGNITGTNVDVGGLIGLVESSSAGAVIRNNGSEGSLVGTGATNVGTLIGKITGSNVVENNYSNMTTTNNAFIGAGSVNGAYIYVLNVNGTTYKRYHGSVIGFVWVSGSPCPIPKDFSWVGGNMSSVTTSSLTSNGFTSI